MPSLFETPGKPECLVLSGGGVKGIFQLGILNHYYEKGELSELKEYCGTSIGSIICALMCMGYTPYEIYSNMDHIPVLSLGAGFDLKNFGLFSIEKVLQPVRDLIVQKFGYSPTFSELHEKTGKTLHVSATSLTIQRTIYFNWKTHPDVEVFQALTYSCNLPFVFKRIIHDSHELVDGGVTDNVPLRHVDDLVKIILCITTKNSMSSFGISDSLMEYASRLFVTATNANSNHGGMSRGDNVRYVEIPVEDVYILKSITPQEISSFFAKGYSHVELIPPFTLTL